MFDKIFHRNPENLARFNSLWAQGKIDIPVIIIIGGPAGSGKTVLTNSLMHHISHCNYLNTTLIRTILRTFVNKNECPELFKNTFDLGTTKDELIAGYIKQCSLVTNYIEKYFESIISERQNYIIEGSNILPHYWDLGKNKGQAVIVDLFMQAPERNQHLSMLTGPTHNRTVDDIQLNNCQLINDYISQEAINKGKHVINYKTPLSKVLQIIDQQIYTSIFK